ncbi:MAG TPA: hypothetical protein VD772_05880 [Anseongella sp.]|nr:hypothetical protein [Anseongella sp.]
MRTLAIVFIVLGIAGLIYSGFTYTKKEKVLDVGPLEVQADDKKTVTWPTIVPAVLLVGGVVMLLTGRKRTR